MKSTAMLLAICLLAPIAAAVPDSRIPLGKNEAALSGSESPLVNRRLGTAIVEIKARCVKCGNHHFGATQAEVESVLKGGFLGELRNQLRNNGVLSRDSATGRLALRVALLEMSQDYSLGGFVQARNVITAGGEQIATVTLEYRLLDGDAEILRQTITTRGHSNSIGWICAPEAVDIALSKNLRVFLLAFKAAADPSFGPTADARIAEISNERQGTRSVLGSLVTYTGKGIGATAGAIGSGLAATAEAMADPAFQAEFNAQMRNISAVQTQADRDVGNAITRASGLRTVDDAVRDAEFAARANASGAGGGGNALGAVLTKVEPITPSDEEIARGKASAEKDRQREQEQAAANQAQQAADKAAAASREDALRKMCMEPGARGSCDCRRFYPDSGGNACGK